MTLRVIREKWGAHVYVGHWAGRINLHPRATFLWREGDSRLTKLIRKCWSGWYRWTDDDWWEPIND